ncbi:DnaD domain protein, partial [Streptococcus suis]
FVGDFELELGRFLSTFEIEDFQKNIEDDKNSIDLVRADLKEAVFNNKTNWKYIQAFLRNWRREGITTVAQVEEKNAERE